MVSKLYYVEVVYRAYVLAANEHDAGRAISEITESEDPSFHVREVKPGDTVNAGWEPSAFPYWVGAEDADDWVTLGEVWPGAGEVSP